MTHRPPAYYFPLKKGIYEVVPGLLPLGTPLGNEDLDQKIFQFDRRFSEFQENKQSCRQEDLDKYLCYANYPKEVSRRVNEFLLHQLAKEWPEYFDLSSKNRFSHLHCSLTKNDLELDENFELLVAHPHYRNAFHALTSQVAEDVAVVVRRENKNWLSAIHLCSPSYWSPRDKIGKDFFAIHTPIPGIDRIINAADGMVDAMISKGPFVRFVWGFSTDSRLNHHPEPPPGIDQKSWRGRIFNLKQPSPFFLRLERQVTYGLPEVGAALFFIHVYHIRGEEIKADPDRRQLLSEAIESMTIESLAYKGLTQSKAALLKWLNN